MDFATTAAAEPASPSDGPLAWLRQGTAEAHERLHRMVDLDRQDWTLDRYRALVERFYRFWKSWQPAVLDRLQDEKLIAPRRRLHLLEADLLALGLGSEQIARIPPHPMVALGGRAARLGSAYVMEGSTLGGQLIARRISVALGVEGEECCRYFLGHGAATGAMWRDFRSYLAAAIAPEERQAALDGAIITFSTIECCLGAFEAA